ncbi:hypothetical protein LEP1GSC058_2707 [Leptospira fainei serovar Hurstbridge str. BUT 6]|uniref:Uncharacterized protein n=1 Tax=Leptospira fainei serovar Hurstbridge str. BUT 6 TaxID=1193011 RepID=S3UWM0_9LEPT|nr:hypothetical protein [Leptospira fainei]EPG73663.1 hypothetical protein LEP1GSC058_2707 [Leptospira fainei serovar Hurstbridge str. BUT 6]
MKRNSLKSGVMSSLFSLKGKRVFLLAALLFSLSHCFFAVDWSKGAGPKGKERGVLQEVPDADEANLSHEELKRAGKKPIFKSEEERRLFEVMSAEAGDSKTAKNCTVLYNSCKDKCWKEFPVPSVETVFTAISVDRKRWACVGTCQNVCNHFDPPSSGGSMPNSGKGNYANPNAPRY